MDEEETILFHGPSVTAVGPVPPPPDLKSALLGTKPTPQPQKIESPFLNLGAPVKATAVKATAPHVPRPRIKYTRDELEKIRRNLLPTDLPPGLDTSFLKEQQEIAAFFDSGGIKGSSPSRSGGFYGPSSWESKRGNFSNQSSIEEPLSSLIARPSDSLQQQPPDGPNLVRNPSWREPYKPPPGSGPVRSALVDSGPLAESPPQQQGFLGGAARRGSEDGWRSGNPRNWDDRSGMGRGGAGGRTGRQDLQPQAGGQRGRGNRNSLEGREGGGGGRWGDPKGGGGDDGNWRSAAGSGKGGAARGPWKDGKDDQNHGINGQRDGHHGKHHDGGGGGRPMMTAAELEEERQRFQAEWRSKIPGGDRAVGATVRSVDDDEADWLKEASNDGLVQDTAVLPSPGQTSTVENLFGDAITGAATSQPAAATAAAAAAPSSRFARWFHLEESPQAHPQALKQAAEAPAQAQAQQQAGVGPGALGGTPFSFEALQQAVAQQQQPGPGQLQQPPAGGPGAGLPESLSLVMNMAGDSGQPGGGAGAMAPMPKMPMTFKTLEELEGGMAPPPAKKPEAPAPTAPKDQAAGSAILQMLQSKPMAPVAAPATPTIVPGPATESSSDWALATAKLAGTAKKNAIGAAPGPPPHIMAEATADSKAQAKLSSPIPEQKLQAPGQIMSSGNNLEEASQLSSLLQGLGIPVKPERPEGAPVGDTEPQALQPSVPIQQPHPQGHKLPPPGFLMGGPGGPPAPQGIPGMPGMMQWPPPGPGHPQMQIPMPQGHPPPGAWPPGMPGPPPPGMMVPPGPGGAHPPPGMRFPGPPPPGMMMPPPGMVMPGLPPHQGHFPPGAPPPGMLPGPAGRAPPGTADGAGLGRFFDLTAFGGGAGAPPMPPMPGNAPMPGKHQTLEELERQLQNK